MSGGLFGGFVFLAASTCAFSTGAIRELFGGFVFLAASTKGRRQEPGAKLFGGFVFLAASTNCRCADRRRRRLVALFPWRLQLVDANTGDMGCCLVALFPWRLQRRPWSEARTPGFSVALFPWRLQRGLRLGWTAFKLFGGFVSLAASTFLPVDAWTRRCSVALFPWWLQRVNCRVVCGDVVWWLCFPGNFNHLNRLPALRWWSARRVVLKYRTAPPSSPAPMAIPRPSAMLPAWT